MLAMTEPARRAEVVRPSDLGPAEEELWRKFQARSPSLHRAFLTPGFAVACERANGRARVAILLEGNAICGFLPFQFRSAWHQRLGLAERIGGDMSDAAGLIAAPEFRITHHRLLRLAGLSSLIISHLMPGQQEFGLEAVWSDLAYLTDLRAGDAAFYQDLLLRERSYVRETERKTRRAAAVYGSLAFTRTDPISTGAIAPLIDLKRQQYRRTQVADVFSNEENTRLIAELLENPTPDCQLVLHQMMAGDRILAQHLGPQYRDVLSIWFPVYDPGAYNVSPGRLLLWHMLREAGKYGIGLIDYGAGDAVYKRKFANTQTRCGRAHWFSGGLRSVVARAYQGMEWRLQARRRRIAGGGFAGEPAPSETETA
jgi:CelD/BcsL family acetyltransferase involved in cellulose biosynthesis